MKNKNSYIWVILAVFVIGGALFWLARQPGNREYSWFPTFEYRGGKQPYDVDLFVDLIASEIPKDNFKVLGSEFSEKNKAGRDGLYLCVNRSYNPGSESVKSLLDYAEKGNTVFIAAEDFNDTFLTAIDDRLGILYCMGDITNSTLLHFDSFTVSTLNGKEKHAPSLGLYPRNWNPFPVFNTDACIDSFETRCTGYTDNHQVNLLEIEIGKGTIYLHSMPVIFTNFNMVDSSAFRYVKEIFSDIHYDEMLYDDFGFLRPDKQDVDVDRNRETNRRSTFSEIFRNRALRIAFYLILIFSLLFIVVAARRRTPAIKIVMEPENASVAFSKTIARLYWLHPNHKKMAHKKIKYFLSEIRQRYNLDIQDTGENFRNKLSKKSGIEIRHINKLFDAYNVVLRTEQIHVELLTQISNSITFIRQNWK
ncbi:MAG: hypothetical protein GC181_04480 [Bacteroidetes bacterium]|nr:hypothetical protein [Bacteroidota bacterium]